MKENEKEKINVQNNEKNIKSEEIDNTIINSAKFATNFAGASISAGAVIWTGIYLIISVIVILILYNPFLTTKTLNFSDITFISFVTSIFTAIPCIIATVLSLISGRIKLFIFNLIYIIVNVTLIFTL